MELPAGLREDGTVVCWGSNQYGQCDAPEGIFTQVAAGNYHTLGYEKTAPSHAGAGMMRGNATLQVAASYKFPAAERVHLVSEPMAQFPVGDTTNSVIVSPQTATSRRFPRQPTEGLLYVPMEQWCVGEVTATIVLPDSSKSLQVDITTQSGCNKMVPSPAGAMDTKVSVTSRVEHSPVLMPATSTPLASEMTVRSCAGVMTLGDSAKHPTEYSPTSP